MIEFKGQRILKDIPCTSMIKRSILGCIHWLEFVYIECHHDIILTLCHSNRSTCCDFSLCHIIYGNFDTPCGISRSRPCTLLPQTNFWNHYTCLRIFHEKNKILFQNDLKHCLPKLHTFSGSNEQISFKKDLAFFCLTLFDNKAHQKNIYG